MIEKRPLIFREIAMVKKITFILAISIGMQMGAIPPYSIANAAISTAAGLIVATGTGVSSVVACKKLNPNTPLTRKQKAVIIASSFTSGLLATFFTGLGLANHHLKKLLSHFEEKIDDIWVYQGDSPKELIEKKDQLKALRRNVLKTPLKQSKLDDLTDKIDKKIARLAQFEKEKIDHLTKQTETITNSTEGSFNEIEKKEKEINDLANMITDFGIFPEINAVKEVIAQKKSVIDELKKQAEEKKADLAAAIKAFDKDAVNNLLDKKFVEPTMDDELFAQCVNELSSKGAHHDAARDILQKIAPEKMFDHYINEAQGDDAASKDRAADILKEMVPNELLSYAAEKQDEKLLQLFLDKGLDPNQPSKKGWMPLHMAASQSNAALIKLLLERGADVNKPLGKSEFLIATDEKNTAYNYSNYSPLDVACAVDTNNIDVFALLLKAGANLNEKDQRLRLSFIQTVQGLRNGTIYFTQEKEFPGYEKAILKIYEERIEHDRLEAERKKKEEEERLERERKEKEQQEREQREKERILREQEANQQANAIA